MATSESSHTTSCPTVEGSADFHNQTIDNTTDLSTSRGSSGWAAVFKDPFEASLLCVQLILCLTNYVGNSLTLAAMSFDKKLKKNMQNKYIMSLAAADQVTGCNLLYLTLTNYSAGDGAWLSCQPHLALLYTASAVSLMHMLTIALDRYFYIVHPFVHMRHVTPRRISVLLIVQWVVAGLYGFVPIYVFNSDKSKGCNPFYLLHRRFVAFSHPILFFIDCFGIGVTYGLIAKVARQQFNKKTKRVQQNNAIIVNCTTKRNKSVDSSSTATEIEQRVVDGDISRFKHTKHQYEHDTDVQPAMATMPSKTEEENVNEASYDSLAPDERNKIMQNKINFDRSDMESVYINENVNVLTNVAQNKFAFSKFEENEVSSVTRNEVVVFQTGNTVASTVNKHISDKKNSALGNQEGILTCDTTIKENRCNKSGKEITGSSDDKNSRYFSDSNVNTITQTSDNIQGKRRLDIDDHTSTEINRNTRLIENETYIDTSSNNITVNGGSAESGANIDPGNNTLTVNSGSAESGANIDTGNNTLTVNSGSAESGANIDTSNNTQTVNSGSAESGANIDPSNNTLTVNSGSAESAYATLVKSNNKTIEKTVKKSLLKHLAQLPEVHRCQTPQQVSPWSLASLRWMKQMIVVFGLFFLCWTPSMVCILISAVREPDHKFVYVMGMFGVANSAVNVFVYSIYNKAYSEAIKKMCCRRRKRT